jgi:hypothetical protein
VCGRSLSCFCLSLMDRSCPVTGPALGCSFRCRVVSSHLDSDIHKQTGSKGENVVKPASTRGWGEIAYTRACSSRCRGPGVLGNEARVKGVHAARSDCTLPVRRLEPSLAKPHLRMSTRPPLPLSKLRASSRRCPLTVIYNLTPIQ